MSTTLASRAFVIHRDTLGTTEERLGKILTFFGVPWQAISLADLARQAPSLRGGAPIAVLGSVESVGAALAIPAGAAILQGAAAVCTFATENREASLRALSTLAGGEWAWGSQSGTVSAAITAACPEVTGAMSGIEAEIRLADGDGTVSSPEGATPFVSIVTVNGAPAFLRFEYKSVPTYFSASAATVDIDATVGSNFYDVKAHFLAAVPLVMFVTSTFRDVMWRPRELGACLIIDDPLLKSRYGFCDFHRLRDAMRQHRFTTNVAFIPWNWRRTTRAGSEFFRRDADLFSVSVHGCDHVAAEFGSSSPETLDSKARLAQARMQAHQQRTGIEHDPVMVFPQGVFSRECPAVLKLNGFVAAVNTEIAPVNSGHARTAVRDVWDTAILSYGAFPIYTRRYASHGIENFAFDLMLGKPCFIVAHHEFFRDGGAALIALVEKLSSLNCTLRWRSPREVIRRAFRRRRSAAGVEEIEMYGNEICVANPDSDMLPLRIRKREPEGRLVSRVECNGRIVETQCDGSSLTFQTTIAGGSDTLVRIAYAASQHESRAGRSLSYEVAVAMRRLLSEFRDEYLQTMKDRLTFRTPRYGVH